MLTLIKPNTTTDPELSWRQSLKPGDEVALEYHERQGICYLIHQVESVNDDCVLCDREPFSIETGLSADGKGLANRIVRPTPEIRERFYLVEDIREQYEDDEVLVFRLLPLDMLRQIAELVGVSLGKAQADAAAALAA